MNDKLHHIRLLAGLEIQPTQNPERILTRAQADELAAYLAADLARVLPQAEQTVLVVAGCLFEPNELIRPGFPAWQALEDLVRTSLRAQEFSPQIVAIGAYSGQLPDAALQPPMAPPQGQFIALPMLIVCPADQAASMASTLERELFERGSIDPPARATLSRAAGMESVHGQLLTLADLMALQHVQLDSAGLAGFWPVVEHVLLDAGQPSQFDLPGGLEAAWQPASDTVEIAFVTLDQSIGTVEDYTLWLRAFRTLTTLLDAHAIAWQARPAAPVVADEQSRMLIETIGPVETDDSLTVHNHPDLGLIAWSVVEDGKLTHLYPLDAAAATAIERDLATRGLPSIHHCDTPCHHPQTGRLQPAQES